jgi:hypothetical protein
MLYTMALQDAGPASGFVCTAVEADAAALAKMESLLMLFPCPPIQCELFDTNLRQYAVLLAAVTAPTAICSPRIAACNLHPSFLLLSLSAQADSSSDCRRQLQATDMQDLLRLVSDDQPWKTPKSNIVSFRLGVFLLITT